MKNITVQVLILTLVAGCVEPTPYQPSAAEQQLQSACNKGDTVACKAIMDKEERAGAAQQARMQEVYADIGNTDALDTYAAVAMRPRQQIPLQPLQPVMITCWPYGQIAAPGPCPK